MKVTMRFTWKKRATGVYRAHLVDDHGEAACRTPLRKGGSPSSWGQVVTELVDAPLGAHGTPYGPVCARCLKAFRASLHASPTSPRAGSEAAQ